VVDTLQTAAHVALLHDLLEYPDQEIPGMRQIELFVASVPSLLHDRLLQIRIEHQPRLYDDDERISSDALHAREFGDSGSPNQAHLHTFVSGVVRIERRFGESPEHEIDLSWRAYYEDWEDEAREALRAGGRAVLSRIFLGTR